ncbi:hypothetical protein D8842_05090 [Streptococcus mitis]|nr:hypothetical protein D8842_05090 [Streptococcus mitis]
MKHFNNFQLAKYSLLKKFSENIGFFLTTTFAYAKILNKISNEGESQT